MPKAPENPCFTILAALVEAALGVLGPGHTNAHMAHSKSVMDKSETSLRVRYVIRKLKPFLS